MEIHQLTGKEREIVTLICKGYRNKEIMSTLGVTEQTVKKHLTSLFKKAGVTDRLQLAMYATKHWPFAITNRNYRERSP